MLLPQLRVTGCELVLLALYILVVYFIIHIVLFVLGSMLEESWSTVPPDGSRRLVTRSLS